MLVRCPLCRTGVVGTVSALFGRWVGRVLMRCRRRCLGVDGGGGWVRGMVVAV